MEFYQELNLLGDKTRLPIVIDGGVLFYAGDFVLVGVKVTPPGLSRRSCGFEPHRVTRLKASRRLRQTPHKRGFGFMKSTPSLC